MPEKETLFSQAKNDRYNVSNVLSDAAYSKQTLYSAPVTQEEEPEINLEEGAPFLESIDPEATIGEYMERYEEEEKEYQDTETEEEAQPEIEEIVEESDMDFEEPDAENLKSTVIREQAEKARASFMDDLQSLDDEIGINEQSSEEDVVEAKPIVEEPHKETRGEDLAEDEDDDDMPDPITLKDLLKPATRRIKKPQFIKQEESALPETEETIAQETTEIPLENGGSEEIAQSNDTDEEPVMQASSVEEDDNSDLEEARAAQKKGQSICEDLHHLQKILEEGRSPLLHKTEVLVPREKTLRLIRSLTAICEVDPSYIDCASEDKLIDRLVSEQTEDDYKPLERARNRAQTIIQNATKQADTILGDAKTLARQLLAETEAEIKEKFDAADEQIAVRMTTTKEESTKKLNEARSELTASRQRSVEILSKYLEKAESDYQGYWERAENTVMASLEQSDAILGRAADIYRKELIAIHQDKEELDEILNSMQKYRKKRFGR